MRPLKKSETVADKSQRSVTDSQGAMGMGAVRVEERVLASFGGLIEAPTRFEPGRDVSCAGVLWALPALLANGLLHRQKECFSLFKGFYGVVHVLLLMGFMALARIKSLEQLRFKPPGEWGHLLGLDRIPEVHTLRAKLEQMAQGPQVESWSASGLVQIATQMFSRWSQENWFKYMIEHFDLEGLGTYALEPVSETTRVVNPEARTLSAQIKSKAMQLTRRRAEYATGELAGPLEVKSAEAYQNRQTKLRETIQALEQELESLKGKRKQIPSHLTLAELPEADRFKQFFRARKHLMDTIKMVAYRAETALAMSLRQYMKRTDDARALLRAIFVTEADICPDETAGTLTVSLHHLTDASSDKLAEQLAEELNATETIFPGTQLKMVFKLVSG